MNLTDELRVLEQKNNQDATRRQTRVLEDAASLQLTEQVLSGVERLQLKIVPKPFDATNVRVAMAEMKEAISGNQSERLMRAEFRLLQDVQLWRLSLSKRDERFTADSLRRFCEEVNKPLNPTIFAALARFYRNLMPSDFVLSKFDFVVTQLFAKKMEYNRRVLRVEPQKLVGHLSELNAEWTGIPANWSKESGKTREAVTEFLRFVTQIKTPQTLEEFLASDFFNRYRSFKRGLGDVFFSPEVTAAAVLSNVEVGNRFAELCETESAALNNAASMAFDFTQKSDVSAIDETSRTHDILQQLTDDKDENAVSPQMNGFINQIQSNGNGSHYSDKNGAKEKQQFATESADAKTLDESPVRQNLIENVFNDARDFPSVIEDSANENESGSESDFNRLTYTENRFAENESKQESSIGDAEEELEWQLAMSEEIIAESANPPKSQEMFSQESFETAVDAENSIGEPKSSSENTTANDLSQNGDFEMVVADEIGDAENSKVVAANDSILLERENLPPFADVLIELAKTQPNADLINEYLSGSTSVDLRTLSLTDFLSLSNAARETTDGALRNRALRLLLVGEDIIRTFETNVENEEFKFNESEILTLLEEMQTVGNSLRLSMREVTGDDKKQRVDTILAAAKSLVETRLRLNSVVVRRNAKNEPKKRLIIDESGDVFTQSYSASASQNAASRRTQQQRETTEKSKLPKAIKSPIAFKFDWWLIGLLAIVVIFVGGWFAFSSSTSEETPISKDVQTLNPQSLIGGEEIASAKVNKQMLICVVNDKWKNLTEDKKKENLRALMNYSKDKKFDAIIMMNKNGEVVANASAKEVKLEQ